MKNLSNPIGGYTDIIGTVFTSAQEASQSSIHIKGTELYVLYSDLCGKDMDKVAKLIENCPREILIKACKQQDYSGRKMVKDYLL